MLRGEGMGTRMDICRLLSFYKSSVAFTYFLWAENSLGNSRGIGIITFIHLTGENVWFQKSLKKPKHKQKTQSDGTQNREGRGIGADPSSKVIEGRGSDLIAFLFNQWHIFMIWFQVGPLGYPMGYSELELLCVNDSKQMKSLGPPATLSLTSSSEADFSKSWALCDSLGKSSFVFLLSPKNAGAETPEP